MSTDDMSYFMDLHNGTCDRTSFALSHCWQRAQSSLIVRGCDFRDQAEPALFPILEGEQAVLSAIFAVECQGQVLVD
jgi:hypothetical protein